nr:cysteine-rich receptor-like protein kinase 10 [Tanacetum cinerariifolium]
MLLGCCVEGPEKMLVYEYLPNKSLDYILFNKDKSPSLHWTQRFQIIIGVIRGLLYLHEEAPIRIIHRDIKASNILLDEKLNPKISDFGLARLFPGDDTHLNTFRISGTHGYMAPEYAMHGYLSVKADVFSFGILVLEIVSGRKVNERQLGAEKSDLLTYTWNLFQTGKQLELVDESLDRCNLSEAAMCIQMGLLCCQAIVADRPDMNALHLMISNDSFTLPRPGKPGLQGRGGRWTTTTSSTLTSTDTTTLTKPSATSSIEEYSKNSISLSSMNEDSSDPFQHNDPFECNDPPEHLNKMTHLSVFEAQLKDCGSYGFFPLKSVRFPNGSIAQHAPATGNNAFVGLVPHLVGKVGLVMTSRDHEEMSEAVVRYNLRPLLCSSMDIGMYYIWQFVVVDHLCLVRQVKDAWNARFSNNRVDDKEYVFR